MTKIKIICPIHGVFDMTPNGHLCGQGCPACAKRPKIDTQVFIEQARAIHGDKYDYSNVNYVNNQTPVEIVCAIHGSFWQNPCKHISRNFGCPKCGIITRAKKQTSNNEEFIKKAIEVHGDKYGYDNVNYVNARTLVNIYCKKHNAYFQQTPMKHLQGHGCQICCESKIERDVRLLLENEHEPYKSQNCHTDDDKRRFMDFFLESKNIVIECQGVQHFKPVEHFGGDEGFNERLSSDIDKYNFCQRNGITMLYYIKEKDCPDDIFDNPSYQGIYKKENVFFSKEELLKRIRG